MISFWNYASAGVAFCLLLGSCGGGSSTPSTTSNGNSGTGDSVLTGVFVDSAVEGVAFATQTQSGNTNAAGEFSYLAGEQVTFSIGTMQLPTIAADAQVSPVDMGETTSDPAATTTNIARLLQSLDQDGNPDNGITIPATAAESSTSINFDVSTDVFENDPAVINLVANSGSVTTELISIDAANAHLNETLGSQLSNNSEIILDLRGSEWISAPPPSSCDGISNRVILRYSQTNFSGERTFVVTQPDGSCLRESVTWDGPFISDINGTGYMFLCGGDAQCTYDEINQSVILAADDPRNDCVDSDGRSEPGARSISHIPGTNAFEYGHCNAFEYTEEYIRQ